MQESAYFIKPDVLKKGLVIIKKPVWNINSSYFCVAMIR